MVLKKGVKMADGIYRDNLAVGERLMVARFTLTAGSVVPEHKHEHEQVSYVVKGRLLYRLDGNEIVLSAGEAQLVPSHAVHGVTALEECEVIDVFSPVREDYV